MITYTQQTKKLKRFERRIIQNMKIMYTEDGARYFDMNGEEIHWGDIVLMNGREQEVYPIASSTALDGYLGVDATNPSWIESGRAYRCQFGVYQFERDDEPVIVKRRKEN